MSLGLKPTKTAYKDEDTNYLALVTGAGFGASGTDADRAGVTDNITTSDCIENMGVDLGRKEVVSIPDICPSCGHPGESLTAITTIPHFKEVANLTVNLFIFCYFYHSRISFSTKHNFSLKRIKSRMAGDNHGLHMYRVWL